jgi:hypothetical protein
MEVEQQIFTVIVTFITVLTSTAAWKFYEKKLQIKQKEKEDNVRDGKLYRDDLRERIVKLETLLKRNWIPSLNALDSLLNTLEIQPLYGSKFIGFDILICDS